MRLLLLCIWLVFSLFVLIISPPRRKPKPFWQEGRTRKKKQDAFPSFCPILPYAQQQLTFVMELFFASKQRFGALFVVGSHPSLPLFLSHCCLCCLCVRFQFGPRSGAHVHARTVRGRHSPPQLRALFHACCLCEECVRSACFIFLFCHPVVSFHPLLSPHLIGAFRYGTRETVMRSISAPPLAPKMCISPTSTHPTLTFVCGGKTLHLHLTISR